MIKNFALKTFPERQLQFIKKFHYALKLKFSSSIEENDFPVTKLLINSGDCVIDIGANIGVYTKLFSECVGPNGKVYSFEPIPQTFEILCSNIKKLRLKNVNLRQCAVSNNNKTATMQIPLYKNGGENFYEARIVNNNTNNNSLKHVDVESRTLESLFEQIPYQISFIKCDAEGHELECIIGALSLIRKFQPACLIEISQDPDNPATKSFEIFNLLKDNNYEVFWFDEIKLKRRKTGDKSTNYFFLSPKQLEILQNSGLL